ncbi:hypothetical protein [Amaricoccus macauensis]|uniref:hypothetical protein n=1 Tax=Amaricoccus macauensis TaxID=57001 RepID=UPI003C7AAB32
MVTRPDMPDDETLAAFVRGDLDPAEAERISGLAREEPQLAADIAMIRGVRAAAETEAAEVNAPGSLGWSRLSRAIDAEKPAEAETGTGQGRGQVFQLRPVWQLAAAAVVAIGLWQVAVVPLLTERPGDLPGYAPVSEAPVEGFNLRVAFAPEATEGEIRALLQEISAEVTGGPSAIGLWTLGFRSETDRADGLTALQASPLVESAQE